MAARSRRWAAIGGIGAVTAVVAAVVAWQVLDEEPQPISLPRAEVAAFATAWEAQDFEVLGRISDDPDGASAATQSYADALELGVVETVATPPVLVGPGRAASDIGLALELTGMGTWRYRIRLPWVQLADGRWVLEWSPALLHPKLGPGQAVRRDEQFAPRGHLLDRAGQPLRQESAVVEVAIQPRRMTDQAAVEAVLQAELGIDPARVRSALEQNWVTPDSRVPITVVDAVAYEERYRDILYPVPGLVFAERTEERLPTPEFAGQTVGSLGEITAEQLEASDGRYQAGDIVGRSGLEARYQDALAGGSTGSVQVLEGETIIETLVSVEGAPAADVRTTLDRRVQIAADAALRGLANPAALVAIDHASGEILAVANTPVDDGFNRALSGQYPPGSTFKVITATALLGSGVTTNQVVSCPAEITVNGRRIRNFESSALGTVPFSEVFVKSCNTGFVALATELGAGPLVTTAEALGFNQDPDIGLAAVGGDFPEPADDAEVAESAIGQGRGVASPLQMATVAAAAANGTWRAPRLVLPTDRAEPAATGGTIPPEVHELMLEVVRRGTGTRAAVAGQTVGGKTGTAEFGTGPELQSHAWFIGFSGPVAFAVVVEGGGVGGQVAAPVAAAFLTELAQG